MKNTLRIVCALSLALAGIGLASCKSGSNQESPGEYLDDAVITTTVKSRLAEDDILKSLEVSVETYRGVVQLSGFVGSQAAVDEAGRVASNVDGVTSVKNDLVVR